MFASVNSSHHPIDFYNMMINQINGVMGMANNKLKFKVRVAWWFRFIYVPIVVASSAIADRRIDKDKLAWWYKRAVVVVYR